ncbi:hypothetical protein [uncultured Limosilactobacillus sp.]|uniref:hypothetical protein n=1 Tax=uncultured Limosilactobacillus sp. TaxID=2837629 RepID=UPI0025E7CBFC|nr:hypothetical protein [uncultured Limosilactobacillus sp.]
MMMYMKGRFLNLDGFEERSFFLKIPESKQLDIRQARRLTGGRNFLVMSSDRGYRIRLAEVGGKLLRMLPEHGRTAGSIICSCRLADGEPMESIDLVRNIPDNEKALQIERIATMHLPKLEANRHIRRLPK